MKLKRVLHRSNSCRCSCYLMHSRKLRCKILKLDRFCCWIFKNSRVPGRDWLLWLFPGMEESFRVSMCVPSSQQVTRFLFSDIRTVIIVDQLHQ